MRNKQKHLPGTDGFCMGVNYWASHAGISMWRDFSAQEVEKDFQALKESGMNMVRIFPLWSDFQPVAAANGCANIFREFAFTDGKSLPSSGLGKYGLDEKMVEKFRIVADLAAKYELKLVVALLTGWMSGAMFVPPVLSGKNLISDFQALRVAQMFIKGFVGAMKDHPAIAAWELGNECNCLSSGSCDCSWNFLHMTTSAIRLADPDRPVYSGMHGGKNYPGKSYNLMMQGELCDALTTHPYPAFTPWCGKSALNTTPAIYHAVAETLFYRGVSGKPAFIEEIGSFGGGYLSEEREEKYIYTVLYSSLAHSIDALLFWCGFSFDRCPDQYPYRWSAMERDLGALDSSRNPGGAAKAMKRFSEELAASPLLAKLPEREVDCCAVLTNLADVWKTAYGCFILSKQAGFEIEFTNIATVDALPESSFYIVPSISSYEVMDIAKYRLLLKKAEEGATVVFTADSGFLQPFVPVFGCEVDYRTEDGERLSFTLNGEEFSVQQSITRRLKKADCEVYAEEMIEHSPVIISREYGKGKLFYVNAALENNALEKGNNLYKVYRFLAEKAELQLEEKSPEIGITRHKLPDGRLLKLYINYSDSPQDAMEGNSVKTLIE